MIQAHTSSTHVASPCACQKSSRDQDGHFKACQRRAEFARAAREIIVEKGLEGLRTRDVAERAGINIATLHYHVPTKEALIHVVAESVRDDFIAQEQTNPRAGMTPHQKLRQEIDDFAELMAHRRDLLTVISEFSERERRDNLLCGVFSDMRAHWHQTITEIFQAGIVDGSFRSGIEPVQAAHIFISSLIGAAKRAELGHADFAAYFDQIERLFVASEPKNHGSAV